MTCRSNVKLDADLAELQRFADGLVTPELQAACNGCPSAPPPPLVLLGPGGDFQTRIGEGGVATIGRVVIDGGAARRGFFGVGPRSWVGLFEIPSRGVRLKNLEPGTEVEWIDIPAAVGETAGEIARKSTAYFEGLCMGIGIGMITLAVLGWLVS